MEKAKFEFGPLQTKWLEALESGKWKQTQEVLKTEKNGKHAYCCLGVLCEVAGLEWKPEGEKFVFGEASDAVELPTGFADAVGLRSPAGDFAQIAAVTVIPTKKVPGFSACNLVTLNDSYGWSFKKIAKYIRSNPENVFTHSA